MFSLDWVLRLSLFGTPEPDSTYKIFGFATRKVLFLQMML